MFWPYFTDYVISWPCGHIVSTFIAISIFISRITARHGRIKMILTASTVFGQKIIGNKFFLDKSQEFQLSDSSK